MSFRADMTTSDLDRQIELLKHYPEVVEKHFRGMLVKNVSVLHSRVRKDVPVRTGNAQSKLRKSVSGKGINMQARVGWWGANQPWYINVVEYGAKPHVIKAKPGQYLRLLNGTYVKEVNHPGISKVGFMAANFSAMQPMLNTELKAAGDAVVKEMAL